MRTILILVLAAAALPAQPPPPEQKDPLGRDTPRDAVFQFLDACHSHNFAKAQRYLDLRNMSPAERAKNGPEAARQLEDLLDDTPFDISMLSRDAEGDLSDNLSPNLERLYGFQVGGQTLELQLERVQLRPGSHVWLVSAESIPLIPKAHQLIRESPLESKLPQPLVTLELFDTPVWRWIALILAAAVLWVTAGLLSWALVAALRSVSGAREFRRPIQVALAVAGFRAALAFVPPATLARLFLERALVMIFSLAAAWAGAILIDLVNSEIKCEYRRVAEN